MKTQIPCAIAIGLSGFGLFGCHQKNTAVRVCFSPPGSQSELLAAAQDQTNERLAADRPSFDGQAIDGQHADVHGPDQGFVEDLTPLSTDSTSIILWGDAFPRTEVRDLDLNLAPGDYAFLCRFAKAEDNLQGTLRVHHPDDQLWQTLQKWQSQVPDQRRRLAYEFELQQKGSRFDSALLSSLQSQLAALDQFDHRLGKMVGSDANRSDNSLNQSGQDAIAIFEPEPATGHSASMAAFLAADVNRVRSADPVCRLLLVANRDEITWKKQSLSQLIGDTLQLRASIRDEISRLEGRKKLRAIVFKSHEGFVQNEKSLRKAKSEFDRVSRQLRELRLHTLALAVREELFVPGGGDGTAREQARAIDAEIRVTETALQRAEVLFAQSVETNPSRVNLHAEVERHQAELENLRSQLATVENVRVALNGVQTNTPAKRVATESLLASANIDPALPHEVLRLLENDSLLTVRLESPTSRSTPRGDHVVQKENKTPVRASVASY
ncbi:MAG: hypothetical protein DHS20C16_15890 [Phycisphaerae bacterium]|nr:MAG: hypothetical protein DHS20C16_15890 [Phycisphaerae bacterium]